MSCRALPSCLVARHLRSCRHELLTDHLSPGQGHTMDLSPLDLPQAVVEAAERLRPWVHRTPVERSYRLGDATTEVFLKLENQQRTGSFKLRGATHKLLSLSPPERARGAVAASSGNHGMAVAYALSQMQGHGVVFVPQDASSAKVEAIRSYGCEVRQEGADCVLTEALARRHAAATGAVYVSPYNDPWVVAGQGSLGVELAEQIEDLDAVFIALGGGGLISGVGSYLRSVRPSLEIVACSPENSCVMHRSAQQGRILDLPSLPTLSDGTAGGVEEGSITLDWVCQTVDHYILVSEDEIRRAMVEIIGGHHQLIEGAAGVAVAAFQKEQRRYRGKRVAIVLCGANIALGTLRQVLAEA